MSMNKFERAKRLFLALGQIGDSFLEESESEWEEFQPKKRRRVVRYSAVGAAASIGIIATVWVLHSRSRGSKVVLQEIA